MPPTVPDRSALPRLDSFGHRSSIRPWRALLLSIPLPLVCALITTHVPALYSIPFALNFLLVALIATIEDLAFALLAASMSVASFTLLLFFGAAPPGFHPVQLNRSITLFAAALLISLSQRTRRLEHKRHLGSLETLEERTSALIETLHASKCASWRLDLGSGQGTRWYSGSFPVFGRPFAELEALPTLRPLLHPDDQPGFDQLTETMRQTTDPVVFDCRTTWPNGELHWLEMRANRLPGKGCVWRGITVDITERKLTESSLLRSEKLAAMGRLASTVAHEINNPLEAVTNLLYLANQDHRLASETRGYIATAEQELARLSEITRLTLGFVRNSSVRQTLRVDEVAESVLSIFHHRLERRQIALERHFDGHATAFIAAHELRQILTNLVSNALDALHDDHRSLIRVSIRVHGNCTAIAVEDNGAGIPAEALPRIFEPFFTTKPEVGTGIGLWVTRELVEACGGHIHAESGDLPNGMRTRFELQLPSHEPTP